MDGDSPGWTAACRWAWRRGRQRAGRRAETPAPTRLSWRLEEAPPPPPASALHLNRQERGVTTSLRSRCYTARRRWQSLTQNHQKLVQHVVQGPDVGGPVGMTEAPLKGEEPGQDLRELTLKQQHGSLMKTCLRVSLFVCNYACWGLSPWRWRGQRRERRQRWRCHLKPTGGADWNSSS